MNNQHGNKGRKHTQETREKIAAAMRQNKNGEVHPEIRIPPQRKEIQAHALKGKPKSPEHKRKIAAAMRHNKNAIRNESPQEYTQRKAHSLETIAKIRAAAQGNHNALKQYAQHTPAQQERVTTQEQPLDNLEAELMAMLNTSSAVNQEEQFDDWDFDALLTNHKEK